MDFARVSVFFNICLISAIFIPVSQEEEKEIQYREEGLEEELNDKFIVHTCIFPLSKNYIPSTPDFIVVIVVDCCCYYFFLQLYIYIYIHRKKQQPQQ